LGYEKDLLILPFDHRGSLLKKLFGIEGRSPTEEESNKYADLKHMIYEGFLKSLEMGVPKETAAILVDEQFCSGIIRDAKESGVMVAMPIEKSGQEEFDFDHTDFRSHIQRANPDFVKVLVRYNPEGEKEANARQIERLKEASDYCKQIQKKFIFELLVPPTNEQLEQVSGDKKKYDLEVRPKMMVKAIEEIQNAGVEPDVWKLEGVERIEDSRALVEQCRANGRTAGIITLGRGEDSEKVKEWLKVGAKVKGIIGFAVGRTVFWEPMKKLNNQTITREEAILEVAENYKGLVDLWVRERA
jgi:myo-inositol catabolism protein IolC